MTGQLEQSTRPTGLLHQQLPVVMATDPNVVRFVSLVDATASELYERVGTKHELLDPAVAPMPIIRWLAGLLALPLPDDLPDEVQRATVSAAARTFPRRGTAGSLGDVLSALAGVPVTVDEPGWVRCRPAPTVPPEPDTGPAHAGAAGADRGVAHHDDHVDRDVDDDPFAPVRIVLGGPSGRSRADLERVIARELRADLTVTVSRSNEVET